MTIGSRWVRHRQALTASESYAIYVDVYCHISKISTLCLCTYVYTCVPVE